MCEAQCSLDVLGLGSLVSTSQQNNQLLPSLLEIHPVTGTIVDSQLRDTFANRFDISWVSSGKPFDPCLNARSRLEVAQVVKPLNEENGFADFNHGATVAPWLHIVNAIRGVLRCPTFELARAASGPVEPFDLGLLAKMGSLFITRPTLFTYTAQRSDLLAISGDLFDMVTSGKVKIEVNQTYALKDAAQAQIDLVARKTTGSTVLIP